MPMKRTIVMVTGLVLLGAPLASQQKSAPPKARYAMDVGTVTGLGAMGGGMGGAMAMMFGGGGREARELHLRLGSTLVPVKGAAQADHFFLPIAKLGKSVPLLAPETGVAREPSGLPEKFERPRGRLLLFWGCGARAPKGQPVVIDFAKLAAGQMPPGLMTLRVPRDPGPTAANSRSYAEWPNRKSAKPPGSASSLIGAHRIAATYAPEIQFALTQDYMAGLTATTTPAGGATQLRWNAVPAATGYSAWAFGATLDGGGAPRDMVWWTSANGREFGGGLWDWLAPETVARLVGEKLVMPPAQTSCLIPAEVRAAAPDMMFGNLIAFGPEANFAYPPRPANPATPWAPDWSARVRYRSMTSWMIGGPAMGNVQGDTPAPKPCKPSVLGVLSGRGC